MKRTLTLVALFLAVSAATLVASYALNVPVSDHSATSDPTATTDAPFYFTTMTHMEGNFKDDRDEDLFDRHVEQIRWAMDLFDEYGAKLTIESEQSFAKANDIAVCYDNPYSEIVFAGQERLSFLSAEGAKDVGVELNSLSKPYNMTGWRIGMALGNPELVAAISKVKENTDSGIFNAVQYAGILALREESGNIDHMLAIYARRRERVLTTLARIGIAINPPKGTFYLWVPTPKGMSSIDFTNRLFEKAAVVVAAGTAYGQYGEGFIRISLTVPDARLEEAMVRIEKAFA